MTPAQIEALTKIIVKERIMEDFATAWEQATAIIDMGLTSPVYREAVEELIQEQLAGETT